MVRHSGYDERKDVDYQNRLSCEMEEEEYPRSMDDGARVCEQIVSHEDL